MDFRLAHTHTTHFNIRPHAHRTHMCVFPKIKAHSHTHILTTAKFWRKIFTFLYVHILVTNLNSGTIRPWKSIESIVGILSSCIVCPKTCKKQCGNRPMWEWEILVFFAKKRAELRSHFANLKNGRTHAHRTHISKGFLHTHRTRASVRARVRVRI